MKGTRNHKPWTTTVVVLTSRNDVEGAVEVEALETLQPGLIGLFVDVEVDRKTGEDVEVLRGGARDVAALHWPNGTTDHLRFAISDDGERSRWVR